MGLELDDAALPLLALDLDRKLLQFALVPLIHVRAVMLPFPHPQDEEDGPDGVEDIDGITEPVREHRHRRGEVVLRQLPLEDYGENVAEHDARDR